MAINIFECGSHVENATAIPVPYLAQQTGTVAGGGTSNVLKGQTGFIVIQSEEACRVDIAETPNPVATSYLIAAGERADFKITKTGLSVGWIAA